MLEALRSFLWVIVPFLIMLGFLVFVHEFGHFIAAKIFKVKVLVFAFGFGPWLAHKKIGETEYGIKPVPLGGYVRLFGDPTELDESDEPITAEDEKRALYAQPAWKKLIIFAMGSILNIAVAFAVAPISYWIGIERSYFEVAEARVGTILPDSPAEKADIQPGDLVLEVNGKRVKNFQDMITNELLNPGREMTYQIQRGNSVIEKKIKLAESKAEKAGYSGIFIPGVEPMVGKTMPGSPADQAGIKPDDRILSINGQPVHYWHEMTGLIQQSQGQVLALEVERNQQKLIVNVQPKYNADEKRYLIGIEQKIPTVYVRYGLREGLSAGFEEAYYWSGLTIRVAGKLFSGQVSWKAMSGPVGIASLTSQAAKAGVARFILMLVIISVNLGIINLIPIPPLDGAHILVTLIESAIRRKLNKKVKEVIWQTTFFLLIGFMLLVTFNDFLRFQEPIMEWAKELLKSLGIK